MLGAITAGGIVVLLVLTALFWRTLFGPGTWGSGGNLVAWVICGGMAFGWTWLLQHERHLQALTLAVQHHKELMAQAQAHHEDMKAHVSAVAESQASGGSTPFPSRERLDGPPATAGRRGGEGM
jgi:Na+/melibiose symporter-like transporter